ncbi:hypothetical protein BDY21DRAFT_374961 [Lineolata rhizophorae]|uniref:rRNA biogenesis protein RRP5 n=1 Tax=Lineolata rhizophorae TaxID=578093 RepID=A0A6A6NP18_9PEZI|nr:hypothetical protein BDY21DRAFT_374961 [Lineolata rhizophorae]
MSNMKRRADGDKGSAKAPKIKIDERPSKRQRKAGHSATEKSKPENYQTQRPKELPAKSSILQKEEKSFPRGGGSVLTPLEHKQIQIEATRDALYENEGSKKAGRRRGSDEEMDDFVEEDKPLLKTGKKKSNAQKTVSELKDGPSVRIEGLGFKRLVPGSMVLGQVCQITSRDIALSLPNNLTGYVPLTSMSDQLTRRIEKLLGEDKGNEMDVDGASDEETEDIELNKMFSLGQYLRALVTAIGDEGKKNKRRIELSINPRDTNGGISKSDVVANSMVQASVASVEDHGLVMDVGFEDKAVRGFMSSREVGHHVDHSKIQEGSVFLCLVAGVISNERTTLKLCADHQKAGNLKKTNFLSDAPSVSVFVPGTAVEMLVTEVEATGLIGKIMGMLATTAELVHSGAGESKKELAKKYPVGSKVKARVICTFPESEPQKVGVSLLDHIVSLDQRTSVVAKVRTGPLEKLQISSFVDQAKVLKIDARRGLFMDVGVPGVQGYAHISNLSDKNVETISEDSGPFKVGSTHRARITGYNWMDGLFILSLEQSVLDQPFLRIEDIRPGEIITGKVERLMLNERGVGGILVQVANGISGKVPEMHISDVALQHPEKRFKEGVSVKARVLSTDPEKHQMRLTLKKSLVNSEAEVWSDYGQITPNAQSVGTITKVQRSGAFVQFYGKVHGFLPVGEMSEAYIKDPTQHFRPGQVVNVHVLSVNSGEESLRVSCKDPSIFGHAQQAAFEQLKVGDRAKGTITEKDADVINLDLDNAGLKAILRISHLTDGSESKNESAMKRMWVGQTLESLLVLEKLDRRHLVVLSNKPSLLKAAESGELLTSLYDVQVGKAVTGFIQNITLDGVFVRFGSGVVGLLRKSQMPMESQQIPHYGFRLFQSLSSKVLSVNPEENRLQLTLLEQKSEEKPRTQPGQLINPVDADVKSIDDFVFGKSTKARIINIKNTQLNVQLADNAKGRIDASEAFNDWDDIKNTKKPLKQFQLRQVISVRIIGIHDSRTFRFLPLSHRRGGNPVWELSTKSKNFPESEDDMLTLEKVNTGVSYMAFINNHGDHCVWVNLSPNVRGRVDFMDLSHDMSKLSNLQKSFPVGSALKVRVKSINAENNKLDLISESANSSESLTWETLKTGMIIPGQITKTADRVITVQLSNTVYGSIPLTELADEFDEAKPAKYRKNEIIQVCVLDVDAPNKKVILSCRPSKVLSSSLPVKDRSISSISQLKPNDIVRGFVKNVWEKGLFISLGPKITGFVRISDLFDTYIKEWRNQFENDQLLTGKVIVADTEAEKVMLTLKPSMLEKDYVPPIQLTDLKKGQVVTGKIRKVEEFGVYILVDNSDNVSGLCHRSQLADVWVEDVRKLYKEGDIVKAKVVKVDPEQGKVGFGLKASYFDDDSDESDEAMDDDDEMSVGGGVELAEADGDDNLEMEGLEGVDLGDIKSISSEDEFDAAQQNLDMMKVDEAVPKPGGGLHTSGFDWTGETLGQEDGDAQSDDEEPSVANDKHKKRKKRKPEIQVDRTGDLDKYGPQSVADYERLLLGEPNSSSLWIQYMAFQLQLNEIGKARNIAERALKIINMSEEDEKMNIWIALLNLENAYGNDDTVEDAFKRACQYSNAEEIHQRLASIYIDSGKHDKADALFQTMTKRKELSVSPSFWLNYATFLLSTLNEPARARALLQRAAQSVPKDKHRLLTSKFGALEFQSPNGDPERGRTIFEGLLDAWPKRGDLWDMFVDLEIARGGDQDNVRRLFERMTSGKMKKKRAAYTFKRWLKWEEKVGGKNSKGAARVRALVEQRENENVE